MRSKKIIASWNKIKPDDATHERVLSNILERVHSDETTKKGSGFNMKILAPIAACMLIALVVTVSVFMQNTRNNASGNGEYPYTLALNHIDSPMEASVIILGHFWHELTAEQLRTILPDLGSPVNAIANYSGDGSLVNVMLTEILPNGDTARFNETYVLTMLQISSTGTMFNPMLYGFVPEMSYVYGIPVFAGVTESVSIQNDGVALFIASFEIDEVSYEVRLHDYIVCESGLNRLTEIVNHIIRNGVADLSILYDPVRVT